MKRKRGGRVKRYSADGRKGILFLFFYMWQKDSGILYKRWEAVNLHMGMETSGGTESKGGGGKGRGKWREG